MIVSSVPIPSGAAGPRPAPAEAPAPVASGRSFGNLAVRDRLRAGRLTPPLESPDGHRDRSTLERLIAESRYLVRTSPVIGSILETRAQITVGDDPAVESLSADRGFAREAERRWLDWAHTEADAGGQMTLAQILAALDTEMAAAGGCLPVLVSAGRGRPNAARSVGLGVQLVEAERLANPNGQQDTDTQKGGVTLGDDGRPLSFTVGAWDPTGRTLRLTGDGVRTLAATGLVYPGRTGSAWLVSSPRLLGSGQLRAEPELTPVIERIEQLESATSGTLLAYKLSAYVALAHKKADPGGVDINTQLAQSMVNAGLADSQAEARELGVWRPAAVLDLDPGDSLDQIDPKHPSAPFQELRLTLLHELCWSLGLPPSVGLARFIRNYSAHRSELAVGWRRIAARQAVYGERFVRPLWKAVIGRLIARGVLGAPDDWDRVRPHFPPMPIFDPKVEAESEAGAVAAGLKLPATALRRFNEHDFEGFAAELGRQLGVLRAAGVEPGAKPTQVSKTETVDAGAGEEGSGP